MTLSPDCAAATANEAASVVFPVPPFCVSRTMVRIKLTRWSIATVLWPSSP